MAALPSQPDNGACRACGRLALSGDRRCSGCGRLRYREFVGFVLGLGLLAASVALVLVLH